MSPKQADKIIALGKPVRVFDTHFRETFTKVFIKRDRWNIETADGGKFDRQYLPVVNARIVEIILK